jgi:hypothetical protein
LPDARCQLFEQRNQMLNSHPNGETKCDSHPNRETMVKDYAVDAAMGCEGLRTAVRSEEN